MLPLDPFVYNINLSSFASNRFFGPAPSQSPLRYLGKMFSSLFARRPVRGRSLPFFFTLYGVSRVGVWLNSLIEPLQDRHVALSAMKRMTLSLSFYSLVWSCTFSFFSVMTALRVTSCGGNPPAAASFKTSLGAAHGVSSLHEPFPSEIRLSFSREKSV